MARAMSSSDDEEPQRSGMASCVNRSGPGADDNRRMHRCRSRARKNQGGLMHRARRRQRLIDAARRCPRGNERGASPSGRAKTSAAAKTTTPTTAGNFFRNQRNLPSHSPSATRSSDPGTSQVDPRPPTTDKPCYPLANGARTQSVTSSPAGENNATEQGKGEWRATKGAGGRWATSKGGMFERELSKSFFMI